MPTNETDVTVVPSTTEQPVTEPQATQEPIVTQEQGDAQQTVQSSELEALDSTGVPMENREAEWKRKYEQVVERFPEYIDQAVQEAAKTFKTVAQEANEPKYTPEQLRGVILDDSGQYSTANKVWAQEQIDKLNEERMAKLLDERFQLTQQRDVDKQKRAEAEAYVIKTFPTMFKKDVNGNVTGWDQNNPMTQLTAQYLKQLGNRPDAVREAARQAFVDYQLSNSTNLQRKAELANSEAAQLKRQQIGIGGGNADVNNLEQQVSVAYEKFKASGSVNDAKTYNMLKGKLSAVKLKG